MAKPRSRYSVEVTAQDIEKAHVGDSYKCVVSQAIARQIKTARKIEVDLQTIRWSDENGRHVFLTPYVVAGYVVAFDAGDEIHPFDFTVRNAVPSIQKRAVTEAAVAAQKTRHKVTHERNRLNKAQTVLTDPASPPEKVAKAEVMVEEAPKRIEAAKAAHEDVKAAYKAAGESISEVRVSDTTRKAPPKVYKTKRREYGHRVLRVNQAEGRKHYA